MRRHPDGAPFCPFTPKALSCFSGISHRIDLTVDKNQALDAVFNLKSVAIVGVAKEGEFNTGRLFFNQVLEYGFKGQIYLVNPKGGEAFGRKIYQQLKDIPGPVDHVISCIRAPLVPQLIKDSAAKGVKAICVFTSGFSEFGTQEGRNLEREIKQLAEDTGVRVIGPNCLGIYSPKAGFSFVSDFPREPGHVALMCQSGGNTVYPVRAGGGRGIRFSKVISYGNAADVDESDLLDYFRTDSETEIVAAYIEGVKDGRQFYRALREISAVKPVVILKGGRTPTGSTMAASHTASLSGSEQVWKGAVRQTGAVFVDTLDELVDMLVTFSFMPRLNGRRIALAGLGGGAGVLAADDWDRSGFVLPQLPQELREAFRVAVGNDAGTILKNPIDLPHLAFGHEAFYQALDKLHSFDGIDLLVFHLPIRAAMLSIATQPMILEREIENIVRLSERPGKPMAAILHYTATCEELDVPVKLVKRLSAAGLPLYFSIASAARAINRYMGYSGNRQTPA